MGSSIILKTILIALGFLQLAMALPKVPAPENLKGVDFSYNHIAVPPNFPPFALDKNGLPVAKELDRWVSLSTPQTVGTQDGHAVSPLAAPWWIKCETSGGSPFYYDVRNAYENAIRRNDRCYQRNYSGCSTHQTSGTASIQFCAPYGAWMPCWQMGAFIRDLTVGCGTWNGRVGGYTDIYNPDMNIWAKVVVFHS